MASACAVLDYTCFNAHLHIKSINDAGGDEITVADHFCLPTYCGSLHWLDIPIPVLTLQMWLDLWFYHQNDKFQSACETMGFGTTCIVLAMPPPLLLFELGLTDGMVIVPAGTLVLPCQNKSATYKLSTVVAGISQAV
jgi:hypothetical protein